MDRIRPRRSRRRYIGMRVWVAGGFTLVCILTATILYLVVNNSSERLLSERSVELAVGRTSRLSGRLATLESDINAIRAEMKAANGEGFAAWYFDLNGELIAPRKDSGRFADRFAYRSVRKAALAGNATAVEIHGGKVTVVGSPVRRDRVDLGAVVGSYSRPIVLKKTLDRLRTSSLRAALIAAIIGTLLGVGIASLITVRLKRLATKADDLASGDFDVRLPVGGADEIGDLARSLDSMRISLKESFRSLTADRDELTAIFDGLNDAVVVIDDASGTVRYRNSAADALLRGGDSLPEVMRAPVGRAALEGFAAHPAMRVGDRAYALQARALPDDHAVLVVVRDRTEEMRKEFAERDFVSNAAHELRNPLAGISSAIEVLRSGAKNDPEARDHFLDRLAADADRMSRLTQSLLTLARVEALGAGEIEVVDVWSAARDVCSQVEVPEGIELTREIEADLAAKADPTLLRQVLIGLVTNALKNTPPPGSVVIRARRTKHDDVLIEVVDTGTGIPQAEVDRVFERFYRRSESRRQEGFGLGLAIARRMVDVMGGQIGARSIEGKGSTFWVQLPVIEQTETPIA